MGNGTQLTPREWVRRAEEWVRLAGALRQHDRPHFTAGAVTLMIETSGDLVIRETKDMTVLAVIPAENVLPILRWCADAYGLTEEREGALLRDVANIVGKFVGSRIDDAVEAEIARAIEGKVGARPSVEVYQSRVVVNFRIVVTPTSGASQNG